MTQTNDILVLTANQIDITPAKKTCPVCNHLFKVKPGKFNNRIACSMRCLLSIMAQDRWANHIKIVKEINEKYNDGPYSRLYPAKICGHFTKKGRSFCPSCTRRGKSFLSKNCVVCGKEFKTYKDEYVTCSKPCNGRHKSNRQLGEKSPGFPREAPGFSHGEEERTVHRTVSFGSS